MPVVALAELQWRVRLSILQQSIMNWLPDINDFCLDVLFLFAIYFISGAGKEFLSTREYQDEMAKRKVNPDEAYLIFPGLAHNAT